MLKRKVVSVEALAAELAASQEAKEKRIAEARAQHSATRSSVIERGRQRAQELRRLEAEARAEAEQAEQLVLKA